MKIALLLSGLQLISILNYAQTSNTSSETTGRNNESRAARPVPATITSMVEGLKKFEGYFTFYYDEKTGRILLEIDKKRLEQEFLYFGGLSSGIGNGIERGQSSSAMAKFSRVGPKILLIQPNYDYRAITSNADEQNAVDLAFAKSVIWDLCRLLQKAINTLST